MLKMFSLSLLTVKFSGSFLTFRRLRELDLRFVKAHKGKNGQVANPVNKQAILMSSVYISTCLVMFDPINPLQGVGLHHVVEKELVGCRIPRNCWPQFLESVGDDILHNCSNDIKI